MNLKDFKKTSENDERAILTNKNGHSFTIAKKSLSRGHLEALKALPLHASSGNNGEPIASSQDNPEEFVPGVDYSKKPTPGEFNASLDEVPEEDPTRGYNEYTAPMGSGLGATSAQAQPPQEQAPPMAPSSEQTNQPADEPARVATDKTQEQPQTKEQFVAEHATKSIDESAQFYQDMMNGHIQPETVQSLYNSKDTLGKIGTLFGLLISGAGSGLSHQPNAVLQMMNEQIKNDLDAQKTNMSNKQNWYRLAMESELNKANISYKDAEKQGILSDIQLKADTHAINHAVMGAMGITQNIVNKMAPGPQKQAAQNLQNGVVKAGQSQVMQNSIDGANAVANNPEGEFAKKNDLLRLGGYGTIAAAKEARHVPGVGDASIPVPENVRQDIVSHQKLQNAAGDLLKYSQGHTNLIPGMPEYNVGVQKARVLQQMVREGLLGTVFRESEKPLLNAFVGENPAGALKAISTQPKLRALLESNTMASNATKEAYGLPAEASKKTGGNEEVRYDKNGKAWTKSEWESAHGKR